MITAIEKAKFIKQFLESVQPLPVKHAYGKEIKDSTNVVTYQKTGMAEIGIALGNKLVSEKDLFLVTVHTKTAHENIVYSEMIKLGTKGTHIEFISESRQIVASSKLSSQNNIYVRLYATDSIDDLKVNNVIAAGATTPTDKVQVMRQFLELAQPLEVSYANTKSIKQVPNVVTYQNISGSIRKGIGNSLISSVLTFLVTVQTQTARENMIFSEMIKLATEGTNIVFVSDSPNTDTTVKGKCKNEIILTLHSSIETTEATYNAEELAEKLAENTTRYLTALKLYGIDLKGELENYGDITVPDGTYDFDAIVELKKQYLDRLVSEEALSSIPSNARTSIQRAQLVKRFLELVQSLPVRYGYVRGIRAEDNYVTYQDMGTVSINRGIGNQLMSERAAFVITVQTKTAEQNMFYSELIKLGTDGSELVFIAENQRKDTTVESGYINTIIVYIYNNMNTVKVVYTAKEVQQLLQDIASRYIFVTNIYRADLASSFIDKLIVPLPEDRLYGYDEVLVMKQEYIDKLLYNTKKI